MTGPRRVAETVRGHPRQTTLAAAAAGLALAATGKTGPYIMGRSLHCGGPDSEGAVHAKCRLSSARLLGTPVSASSFPSNSSETQPR